MSALWVEENQEGVGEVNGNCGVIIEDEDRGVIYTLDVNFDAHAEEPKTHEYPGYPAYTEINTVKCRNIGVMSGDIETTAHILDGNEIAIGSWAIETYTKEIERQVEEHLSKLDEREPEYDEERNWPR
jgi:hypothetical protein